LRLTTRATAEGRRTVLGLGDRELDLPAEAHPFLRELLTHPSGFVASDAGGDLDDASRLAIVRRLAAEGVVAEPAQGAVAGG
jgi:hypothetical protein